jgi:hypothetical protein
VVDEDGRVRLEAQCLSEPAALIATLQRAGDGFVRIGLEAGPLSQCGALRIGCPDDRCGQRVERRLSASTGHIGHRWRAWRHALQEASPAATAGAEIVPPDSPARVSPRPVNVQVFQGNVTHLGSMLALLGNWSPEMPDGCRVNR